MQKRNKQKESLPRDTYSGTSAGGVRNHSRRERQEPQQGRWPGATRWGGVGCGASCWMDIIVPEAAHQVWV